MRSACAGSNPAVRIHFRPMNYHPFPHGKTSYHSGEYLIQLEVLPDSALTEQDVSSIIAYATWTQDPNTAPAFEGGRSIVIPAEQERLVAGIRLSALQISGIGFRRFDLSQGYLKVDPHFQPPSIDNFLEKLPPDAGGYCYAEGDKLKTVRRDYTPFGTYRSDELETKVRNTVSASAKLTHPVVPPIEAYGWYLNGPVPHSGFIVTRVPHIHKERLYRELIKETPGRSAKWLYDQCLEHLAQLMNVLREMHRKRIVHLEPHLSNWYNGTTPVLTDWETMRLVQRDREGFLNRSLDVMITVKEFSDVFHKLLQWSEQDDDLVRAFHLHAAEEYGGHTDSLIDLSVPGLRDVARWMEQFG